MTTSDRPGYLPELDGLRAVAVAAVVAYHLGLGWAAGGFLGVDLFFVISGFLITTLLLDEHARSGRIDIRSFWVRRFKRLMPPLITMVAATVIATRLWGVPEQWQTIRIDAASALGYIANWRFVIGEQSYFDTLLGPSPLRHTWSLAVEEQWYIVWPLAMFALTALATRTSTRTSTRDSAQSRRHLRIALLVFVFAVMSAALMAVLYRAADPSRVYYGTDTRAQQLLIGAAAAWCRVGAPQAFSRTALQRLRWPITMCGAALLVAAMFVADDAAWLYRGGLFVLSLMAAVLVLAVSHPGSITTLRWLGTSWLVALGRRSYGIYLWHWPVIVFVGAPMGVTITGAPLILLQVGVTLLLTELAHRMVENPVRFSTTTPSRVIGQWSVIALVTAVMSMVILDPPADRAQQASAERVSSIDLDAARQSTPSPATPSPATTSTPDPAIDVPVDHIIEPVIEPASGVVETAAPVAQVRPITVGTPPKATVPAPPSRLLILGDSRASQLAYTLSDADTRDWQVDTYTLLGCAITDGATIDPGQSRPTRHGPYCDDWAADWATITTIVQPDVSVVMAGAWEVLDHRVDGSTIAFPSDAWTAQVSSSLQHAVDLAKGPDTTVALTTLPCMQQPANEAFPTSARNEPARVAAYNTIVADLSTANDDVVAIDLAAFLCPGGRYTATVDGHDMFTDGVHLTPFGVDRLWTWLLDEVDGLRSSDDRNAASSDPTTSRPRPQRTAPDQPPQLL